MEETLYNIEQVKENFDAEISGDFFELVAMSQDYLQEQELRELFNQ
jgi:hypothetical protein